MKQRPSLIGKHQLTLHQHRPGMKKCRRSRSRCPSKSVLQRFVLPCNQLETDFRQTSVRELVSWRVV
jgi:hypothetical protein